MRENELKTFLLLTSRTLFFTSSSPKGKLRQEKVNKGDEANASGIENLGGENILNFPHCFY
jgi:hypothetical protein